MADTPQLSPLSPFTRGVEPAVWSNAGLRVTETERAAKHLLVGNADCLIPALRALLGAGFTLPLGPTLTQVSLVAACVWLAPRQWLLLTSAAIAKTVRNSFEKMALDGSGAVFDVSARFAQLTIAGTRATDLLSVGCSLDFRSGGFYAGQCVQTRIDQIPLILYRRTITEFDLLVERPLAAYLWLWLHTAAQEFQSQELT